jgi:predicted nucleic acid-binding protein
LEHAATVYAALRRSGRTVEDADILISAFCIVNGYTLVTNNTKHFADIDGLQLANWATEV